MVTIFNNINKVEEEKLKKILEMKVISYKENTYIPSLINNDVAGIILSGSVEISKFDYNGNKVIIDEYTENSVISNKFLYTLDELTMKVTEQCDILFFDYDNVMNYDATNTKYYNQFIKNLLNITNNIIKSINMRVEIISKRTIRDKLLEYFKIESIKCGSRIIYLPLSYTDLAYYLYVDRSALSREISSLKKEGFIETKGRKITLINY